MRQAVKAALEIFGGARRFNAALEMVLSEATLDERSEYRAAMLSSLGSTVIAGVVQRRVEALLRTDWKPGMEAGNDEGTEMANARAR